LRIDKKIEHLRNKDKKDSITSIKKIKYYHYNETNENCLSRKVDNVQQFSSSRPLVSLDNDNENLIEINLDSENYFNFNNKSLLDTINNK